MPNLIVIMGVSGCGKSTISMRFGEHTGWPVLEGDDFHPQANVDKMASGQPLTDQDRAQWLDALNIAIQGADPDIPVILACSALTPYVRKRLETGSGRTIDWVWLDAPHHFIQARMDARKDHFMPPALLQSQFDTLSAPENSQQINATHPIETIVKKLQTLYKIT